MVERTSTVASEAAGGPMMSAARRPRWAVAVQATVLAVLLVLVLRHVDREQLRPAFESVTLASFCVFVALMFAVRMLAAWRWLVVARDHVGLDGLSFGFLLRVELLADFANVWLPSLIGGEAVRVWQVIQRTGEKRLGPGSVVLDRFVGTVTLGLGCLPFLAVVAVHAPSLELPEVTVHPGVAALAALMAAAGAWMAVRYVEAFRSLARRALASAVRSRFMAVPAMISLGAFPLMAAAHYLGVPELAAHSWLVAATVAILPRLGRAIPLSVFGVTAVEGAMFAVGKLLGVDSETLLVVIALNLAARYLGAFAGALAEMSLHGTRFFRDVRDARRRNHGGHRPVTRVGGTG